ncbi:MAG: hypothetical protein JNL87_04900 [Burkholderiaceae bacterium]|nr:hypothetical protein [Burkholderiaceae bacterium]
MPAHTVAADLIDLIETRLGPVLAPRIRAVHLPPMPWTGAKDGEFGAVELDSGALGLSYVLLDDTLAALAGVDGQALVGSDALALARRWRDGAGAERTLGFAAVNALSRHLFDRDGRVPPDATDSIGGLDPQPGEQIGMVGFFPPLVKPVTEHGARLTVVELRADLAGSHPGFEVTLDPAALQTCDKVLMTSTVLLNDTLDTVLAHCRRAKAVVMIGPGAGCLPEPLFERGVTALGGTWIEDRTAFIAALHSGAPWGRFARKTIWRRA